MTVDARPTLFRVQLVEDDKVTHTEIGDVHPAIQKLLTWRAACGRFDKDFDIRVEVVGKVDE